MLTRKWVTTAPRCARLNGSWLIAETDPPHWQAWGQLHEAVRSGRTAVPELFGMHIYDYYAAHPADLAYFSRAMGNVSAQVAGGTVQHYDFSIAASFPESGVGLLGVSFAFGPDRLLKSWPELQSNYAARPRRVSAGGLAPPFSKVIMQIQLGSSRTVRGSIPMPSHAVRLQRLTYES